MSAQSFITFRNRKYLINWMTSIMSKFKTISCSMPNTSRQHLMCFVSTTKLNPNFRYQYGSNHVGSDGPLKILKNTFYPFAWRLLCPSKINIIKVFTKHKEYDIHISIHVNIFEKLIHVSHKDIPFYNMHNDVKVCLNLYEKQNKEKC